MTSDNHHICMVGEYRQGLHNPMTPRSSSRSQRSLPFFAEFAGFSLVWRLRLSSLGRRYHIPRYACFSIFILKFPTDQLEPYFDDIFINFGSFIVINVHLSLEYIPLQHINIFSTCRPAILAVYLCKQGFTWISNFPPCHFSYTWILLRVFQWKKTHLS